LILDAAEVNKETGSRLGEKCFSRMD
jgi:hypothetical protein